jgi:hypothetical protein
MKMKEKLLVLLVLVGGVELSAQTIVQQFAALSSGAGDVSDMDLNAPTGEGHVLIAMPEQLSPGVKVVSVTDNAPGGGNTYKQVRDASSSCPSRLLDIWYCENCKAGVTELKFHLSGGVKASINGFLELANMATSSVLDGSGVHLSDATVSGDGLEVGPRITTTATDFIVARYPISVPGPTAQGVTPATWKFTTSYVYELNAPSGTYQPTLTGARAAAQYCMSLAAFKTAAPAAASH